MLVCLLVCGGLLSLGAAPRKNLERWDYFKKWLSEDVAYPIRPEERATFLKHTTEGEKAQFIEPFWRRRKRNPEVPGNEFKEEHYRRIACVRPHFHAGVTRL